LFVQRERAEIGSGASHYSFAYGNYVHEAGFARVTIALIGLLILFFPYRKGERWAVVALSIIGFTYEIPVFLLNAVPNLGTWPIFRNLPESHVYGLTFVAWSNFALTALLLAGLALALPQLLRQKTGVH